MRSSSRDFKCHQTNQCAFLVWSTMTRTCVVLYLTAWVLNNCCQPPLDSSVGRAEDCSMVDEADILRSLVQIRLEGKFLSNHWCRNFLIGTTNCLQKYPPTQLTITFRGFSLNMCWNPKKIHNANDELFGRSILQTIVFASDTDLKFHCHNNLFLSVSAQ